MPSTAGRLGAAFSLRFFRICAHEAVCLFNDAFFWWSAARGETRGESSASSTPGRLGELAVKNVNGIY